jgi:CheY-like chemotaxis protein
MKILVVHRNSEVQAEVKAALQTMQPYIRFFNSGLDGLLMARVEEFDWVISGTDLPVVTGFEMVRSIRTYSINQVTRVVFIVDDTDKKYDSLFRALNVEGLLERGEIEDKLLSILKSSEANKGSSTAGNRYNLSLN